MTPHSRIVLSFAMFFASLAYIALALVDSASAVAVGVGYIALLFTLAMAERIGKVKR